MAEGTEIAVEAARETKPTTNHTPRFVREGERSWAIEGRGKPHNILLELIIPMKCNIEKWHRVKLAKHKPTTKHLTTRGFRSIVLVAIHWGKGLRRILCN